jgi:hypothetical protein
MFDDLFYLDYSNNNPKEKILLVVWNKDTEVDLRLRDCALIYVQALKLQCCPQNSGCSLQIS